MIVHSDIALPGLARLEADLAPDVTIIGGTVPTMLASPILDRPRMQMTARQYLAWVPEVGRFLIEDGRSIIYAVEQDAAPEKVALFLVGRMFAALLHQRGDVVLHASAIEVGGRAVLFCGHSGAGKSTLAAALVREGLRLISDDQCAIVIDPQSAPMVRADGRQLKLWQPSIDALTLGASRQAPVYASAGKYYVEPASGRASTLPIGAIYLLADAVATAAVEISTPARADGIGLLIANAYRPGLMRRMERSAAYLHAGAEIAQHAGIFSISRPKQFVAMPAMIAALADHWRQIGLSG
ncbi:HPr kinase/phosphorylase [Sphingomonas sp. 28-63-12]|uniref:HPr kinase/phosphorylase n=1 Tax=Sphingomonas sp. 28-63-12 TaxID=1970434 RepID=UPI0035A84502